MSDKVNLYDLAMEMAEGMRHSTPEDQKAVSDYIKSVSTPTGFNVFSLYGEDQLITAIEVDITMTALEIANGLSNRIMIVPTNDGNILFEDKHLEDYLSIEVGRDFIEVMYIKSMDPKQVSKRMITEDMVEYAINLLNNFHKGEYNDEQFK